MLIAFSTAVAIIWSVPFIIAPLFKWQLYKITDRTMILFIQKKINLVATIISDDKPVGFVCGKWFVGYLMESSSERGDSTITLYILCNVAFYKKLTSNKTGENDDANKQLTIYERYGSFFQLHYRKRMLDLDSYVPSDAQKIVMDRVITYYMENSRAVAYVHGAAGCGKSMLAMMLAAALDGTFCQTFDPSQPGDNLSELFYLAEPTKKNPLIILLDEVDVMLDKVHQTFLPHKYIPIEINNKIGWNRFFDSINRKYYKNVIIIMTSNKTPEFYNEIDPAYLRVGRVDITAELVK